MLAFHLLFLCVGFQFTQGQKEATTCKNAAVSKLMERLFDFLHPFGLQQEMSFAIFEAFFDSFSL